MSCRDPGPQQLPKEEVRYGPTVNLVSGRLVAYNEDTCERVLGKLGPWQIGPRAIFVANWAPADWAPANWAPGRLGPENFGCGKLGQRSYLSQAIQAALV